MKAKFPFEAGVLVRKALRNHLEASANWNGVNAQIYENKGFLNSAFEVILEGESEAVHTVIDDFLKFVKALQ